MTHEGAIAFHPGSYVKDELETRGWTQKDLSVIISKSTNEVNEVITGKRNISPKRALLLSAAFGTSEDLRMGLQKDYDIFREKNKFPKGFLEQIKVRAEEYVIVT